MSEAALREQDGLGPPLVRSDEQWTTVLTRAASSPLGLSVFVRPTFDSARRARTSPNGGTVLQVITHIEGAMPLMELRGTRHAFSQGRTPLAG